jgi:hypothetical protein
MEHNVVTLQTAKTLKTAGFKIEPILWRVKMSGSAWRVTSMGIGESNRYAAPTAQEIADQLPGVVNVQRDNTGWWCSGADLGASYDTMAEALAALWLRLHGGTV